MASQRYTTTPADHENGPAEWLDQGDLVGIVDGQEGSIVAYVHKDSARVLTDRLNGLAPEEGRVYLVSLGIPVEFNGDALEVAHDYAQQLVERFEGLPHATITVAEHNWRDYTMVAERIGTRFTTPGDLSRPGPEEQGFEYYSNL